MKKTPLILAIIIGLLLVLFYTLNNYIYQEKQGTGAIHEPYQGTLTGTQVCLPHKDTTGPQTLECAIGLKTDVGEYYALDLNLAGELPPEVQSGARFTASGTITPVERLSTDHLQKYDIEGILSVSGPVVVE